MSHVLSYVDWNFRLEYIYSEKSLDLFCMMFMFFREHVVVTHVLSYVD